MYFSEDRSYSCCCWPVPIEVLCSLLLVSVHLNSMFVVLDQYASRLYMCRGGYINACLYLNQVFVQLDQ